MAVLAVAHTEKLVRVADQVWRLAEGRLVAVNQVQGRAALGG
jgi:ABC-type transport system involved in cytochrome bd biosynthesis fused ATPase/permease subunit